jgi:hypothetical protein
MGRVVPKKRGVASVTLDPYMSGTTLPGDALQLKVHAMGFELREFASRNGLQRAAKGQLG